MHKKRGPECAGAETIPSPKMNPAKVRMSYDIKPSPHERRMDTSSKPKRWTEIARELQRAQRTEVSHRDRAIREQGGTALFCSFDQRTILGLPHLQEGRDEDM
jgi:hypothetical protein